MPFTSVEYQLTLPIAVATKTCIKQLFYRENRMHGRCSSLLKMDAKAIQKKEQHGKERKDYTSQLMYTETNDSSEIVSALFSVHVHTVLEGEDVPSGIHVGDVVCTCVYGIVAEDATLTVWPTTPPAQWTVHPNLPAFYQHAKYLVMSSTQEVTEVMTSHSSTSDDCVQLRAEDIVG